MVQPLASAPVQGPVVDQRGMVTTPWFQWFNQGLYPRVNASLQSITLTGDVTGSGGASFATTIAPGAVTLGKMAPLPPIRILGNNGLVDATPQALTSDQVTAMLGVFSPIEQGVVPASGGGTVNYLRADGLWVVPPAAGPAGGDLAGTYPNPTVGGLLGFGLPILGGAGNLRWSGSAWTMDTSTYATQAWVSGQGYLTGITGAQVTTALGYTPQVAYTNLTNIGGLANAAGVLVNNGSGTFSYSSAPALTGTNFTGTAASLTAGLAQGLTGTPNITVGTLGCGVATGTSFNGVTGLASATPLVNGTATVGTSTKAAREDHVHGTDTSRAPTASPTFTGTAAFASASLTGTLASTNSTASTSPTTGAATFTGGVGVGGNVTTGGVFFVYNTATTGSVILNATGSAYGAIGTASATSWGLGYTASAGGGTVYYVLTWDSSGNTVLPRGSLDISLVGAGLKVAEGANAKQGTATLAAGTVTVNNTSVTATSRIFLTIQSPGGTVGAVYVNARVAGTSFTIKSTSASDTSVVAWEIFEVG